MRLSTLMNLMPRLILAGPLHRLMSSRYAVLELTGRRSGRRYVLPVAYQERDGRLWASTDSGWWVNAVDGRPFHVRLRGRRYAATAHRVDQDTARTALRGLVTIPGYAKAAGIERVAGVVSPDALDRAAAERAVLAITTEVAR